MKTKKLLFLTFNFLLFTFFTACSTKTTPIYTVIKSPKIKIADQGFLEKGVGYKKIVIYKAGMEPFSITIKNSFICINNKCQDKKNVINSLNKQYPADFFDKILNQKPLEFLGKIRKINNGFIQTKDAYLYKVTKNKVLFKDKNAHILILIKFLKGKG
ncbi:hypothetical protein FE773_01660 [Caminibacter mediatlanticus TB-2]|uniref:Lipoprotein n=1 Tax=Caminibacter mediatlanticus TB-2 TaxID=391592 RepID=A0AAI9AGG3_9BACT|nr:hypothetical protein [Caminibacter mediatlanticus]EDM23187.1 putative lipoprotein [Caminibacter mediatlanticus TB-2]QCT93931.1 hypothetical protein FE773_01660 [Caminibacter mediatlanticus TB-2]